MTHQAEEQNNRTGRRLPWVLIGPLLLVGLTLLFTIAGRSNRPLKPIRPTPTRGMSTVQGQPILVSFAELNEDPTSFQNKRIRVTGSYMRLTPPDCSPYSGPGTRWALVNNEGETPLRLEATGFKSVLRLVPEDTILTVDGILRLYAGPSGCGKEPREPGPSIWYLKAEQIVQPNPLPQVTPGRPVPERTGVGTPTTETTATPGGAEIPTTTPGTATPTPTLSTTVTPTPAFTPNLTATQTPTAGSVTPGTPTTGTATATASRTPTPTRTGTVQPGGTATTTPTGTQTPTSGPTQPSFATATPGSGYPPPSGTATPTATSGSSYP
jgi:hypothetical protein